MSAPRSNMRYREFLETAQGKAVKIACQNSWFDLMKDPAFKSHVGGGRSEFWDVFLLAFIEGCAHELHKLNAVLSYHPELFTKTVTEEHSLLQKKD